MDRKKHRDDRAGYFKRQLERYERVLAQFDFKTLAKLQEGGSASLTDAQIAAMLEFLDQEGFGLFQTRDDVLKVDRTFWGSESDVAQTATADQLSKFKDYPKARNIFARLLLPKLLQRLDAHDSDRREFTVDEYFSLSNESSGSVESAIKFFGWARQASITDSQIAKTLKFLDESELQKTYQDHPVHLLLVRYADALSEVESWGLHISGAKADATEQIKEASKQFNTAYQPTQWSEHHIPALIDSLFAITLSPKDPTPFVDAEEIKLRQSGVAALQLSAAVVPQLLGVLISEVKVQYILNRPFAFAAMARAALEELLRYHNDKRVKDSNRQLASRIADMRRDNYRDSAQLIKKFGDRALHEPSSMDMSKSDHEMQECMKRLDALATHFLPNRRQT